MREPYRHTQIGYLTIGGLGFGLTVAAAILATGFRPMVLAIFLLFALLLPLFATLTVSVDSERVQVRFGVGLIRFAFPVRQIRSVRPVTNSPLYGWGLRLTLTGWLFNVSGRRAVEIELRDARRIRLGTDEPEALARAIEQVIRA